jgi:hypothetical protein
VVHERHKKRRCRPKTRLHVQLFRINWMVTEDTPPCCNAKCRHAIGPVAIPNSARPRSRLALAHKTARKTADGGTARHYLHHPPSTIGTTSVCARRKPTIRSPPQQPVRVFQVLAQQSLTAKEFHWQWPRLDLLSALHSRWQRRQWRQRDWCC